MNLPPVQPTARVLVIDDDHALLHALADLLTFRLENLSVETCADPARAVDHVRRGNYAVILCDVRMPKMSGLDLVPQLRQAAPGCPIIVMTGGTEDASRSTARRHGARFISKPFDRELVCRMVADALRDRPAAHVRLSEQLLSFRLGTTSHG